MSNDNNDDLKPYFEEVKKGERGILGHAVYSSRDGLRQYLKNIITESDQDHDPDFSSAEFLANLAVEVFREMCPDATDEVLYRFLVHVGADSMATCGGAVSDYLDEKRRRRNDNVTLEQVRDAAKKFPVKAHAAEYLSIEPRHYYRLFAKAFPKTGR